MADAADIVIRVRTDGVAGADAALRRLEAQGVRVERVSGSLENQFRRTAQSAQFFHTAVGAVATIMTATSFISYISQLGQLSDAWTNVTNKLANANSANEDMGLIQDRVFGIAQRTRTSLEATSTLYARMERSLSQYNVTGKQVAQITETINKSMIVSGATTAESTAAIIQFSQGLQSGVLRGDEFRSVMEQAPRLGKMIADGLGVGTAGLRQMANTGQLTADVVINAISKASGTIDEEFGRTMPTFSQRMELATNNVVKFAGTNRSVQTVVKGLGDTIESLSNNMEVVSGVATALTAILGGRMLTALGSQIGSMGRLALLQGSSSALHIKTVDAITRESVARYNNAQATLAELAAERQRIQAALAANQQYYRGIATQNALMQNTLKVRQATDTVTAASGAMAQRMGVAAAASRVLTVGLTGARMALGLLGGPLGLIMLAASGWYMYDQYQKQAVSSSRDLASGTKELTDKLATLNLEQQKGLLAKTQLAQFTLAEQLTREKQAHAEAAQTATIYRQRLDQLTVGSSAYMEQEQKVARAEAERDVAAANVAETQRQLNQAGDNATLIQRNLTSAVMGHTGAILAQNEAMNINLVTTKQRSNSLVKALQAQDNELIISEMRLKGNGRGAAQMQDAMAKLGDEYGKHEQFIKNYINGAMPISTVWDDNTLAIKEFLDKSGKAYDNQEAARQNKKDAAQALRDSKAMERYAEQWDKAYERVEARGATGLERLRIQQDSEIRIIKDKAEKSKASAEELGNALNAIEVKYARQRQDIAMQYKPSAANVRDLKNTTDEITKAQGLGLLTEKQGYAARLNAYADYNQKKAEMTSAFNTVVTIDSNQTAELQRLQAQQQLALEMAGQDNELKLQIQEQYEQKRTDIENRYAQQRMVAQNQASLNYIQSVSTMADTMAIVLEAAGAKGSGAYKAMFALSKGFAIANATLNLTSAISQAMADPASLSPAQKFANMASIAAAGGSLIQQIMSASLTGMAHDGISNIPSEGTWLLQKGERVLSPQQNSDFTRFINGGGNGGGNSAPNVTINQSFVINGNGDQALTTAMQQAAKQGAQEGYQKVLTDFNSRGTISKSAGR